MNLSLKKQGVLERYGLALTLAALALLIRMALPVPLGTTIYQLPLAAVVLSAWFGGRGPGLFASLICATGVLYWFIPPVNSFDISPGYLLPLAIFIGLCLLLTEFGEARLRVRRALEESEGRFRQMAETVPEMLWFQSVEPPALLYVSPRYEEIWGQAFDDLRSGAIDWLESVHPEDRDGVRSEYERWLSGEGTGRLDVTFRIIRPDGETRWLRSRANLIRDARGKPYRGSGITKDVTAEKRAQEALANAQTELRARQEMLDLAQQAARAVAFDWYIGARESENRWSPDLEAMYGLEPGTFDHTFQSWKKLIHPDDWPTVKLAIQRAQASGEVVAEYRVIHKDGTVRWLQTRGRMLFDADGRPDRIVGFMIDVTDRRHAEEELRDTEARFRIFVDRATDGFFLLDEQLSVVDVNQQACESLGWSREDLIGMHPRDFDASLDEASILRLAGRAGAGEIITFETRHRRKDGTIFPVEIRAGTFREAGKLFYLALVRDTTERKREEERTAKLAAIVESSDDAIISKDLNGIITTWNSGAERMFGYAAREVIGQPVTILVPPDRVDDVRGILERIRRGERVDHFETVRRRKDGTLLDISLTVSPIIDASGKIVGASKIARDISERKRAEDALRQTDDALEMARTELARVTRVTALGELTASIAHEVAQPLGGMIANAGACTRWLFADPPDIAEARAALDNIAADGKRAREVIARIRAFTKRQVPRKEKLDINQEALDVLALTERELRGHDIVLRTQLDSTLPGVAGDRVQLQQVLINLIMNAIEAMSRVRDRPRELTIVTGQDGPKAIRIEVRDSGVGLDSKGAEHVFEAFYTTKAEGIGIGLSVSRSIVEGHGGRLWASPNEPHGAVFRFSLPVPEETFS